MFKYFLIVNTFFSHHCGTYLAESDTVSPSVSMQHKSGCVSVIVGCAFNIEPTAL